MGSSESKVAHTMPPRTVHAQKPNPPKQENESSQRQPGKRAKFVQK